MTVQSNGTRTTAEHPFTGMGCYAGRITSS
jgi:hypothetical protein